MEPSGATAARGQDPCRAPRPPRRRREPGGRRQRRPAPVPGSRRSVRPLEPPSVIRALQHAALAVAEGSGHAGGGSDRRTPVPGPPSGTGPTALRAASRRAAVPRPPRSGPPDANTPEDRIGVGEARATAPPWCARVRPRQGASSAKVACSTSAGVLKIGGGVDAAAQATKEQPPLRSDPGTARWSPRPPVAPLPPQTTRRFLFLAVAIGGLTALLLIAQALADCARRHGRVPPITRLPCFTPRRTACPAGGDSRSIAPRLGGRAHRAPGVRLGQVGAPAGHRRTPRSQQGPAGLERNDPGRLSTTH